MLTCSADAITSAAPVHSADGMIVIHPESGAVLCQKNADEQMLIASTTKIMTALVALECLDPDQEVVVDPAWTRVEGSSMYLRSGETYTVRELLYGLLLASGNDAALALACTACGSAEAFADQMNDRAAELGLKNTHFANPHGLDSNEHYSTAHDLAIIMAEAMKNEVFAQIVSARSFSAHGATYVNHNKLLWRCEGITGGKTGYTKAAGRCLVTTCQRDGLSLICVTLSDPNDWKDHSALYDWAYETYEARVYSKDIPLVQIPVISGDSQWAAVAPENDIRLCIPRGSHVNLHYYLPRYIFARVEAGKKAGDVVVSVDEERIGVWSLCWAQDVDSVKGTLFNRVSKSLLGI